MEENTEEEKKELPPDGAQTETAEDELPTDEEMLECALLLIDNGELEKAQDMIDAVKEKSGKKYFVQSKLFEKKGWYNEQRKQLKAAIKAEPDNEEYKTKLAELEEFRKTPEYKSTVRKQQMGSVGEICAEGGAECCCVCLCEGVCEGLGNGC